MGVGMMSNGILGDLGGGKFFFFASSRLRGEKSFFSVRSVSSVLKILSLALFNNGYRMRKAHTAFLTKRVRLASGMTAI